MPHAIQSPGLAAAPAIGMHAPHTIPVAIARAGLLRAALSLSFKTSLPPSTAVTDFAASAASTAATGAPTDPIICADNNKVKVAFFATLTNFFF